MKPIYTLAVLCAAGVLGACAPKTQKFQSESGRFSVAAPIELIESSRFLDAEIGSVALHEFTGQDQTTSFAVKYSDSPYNLEKLAPDAVLDNVRESMLKEAQGKLTSEKKITLNGHPGRELVGIGLDGKNEFEFNDRIFVAGHRIYTFLVTAPKGSLNQVAADAFMQSANISPPPPSAAPGVIAPEGGKFSIETPVALTETAKVQKGPNTKFTDHLFNGSEDGPIYLVEYFDLPIAPPADPDAFLNMVADSSTKTVSGKILSAKHINLGPYPGLEFVYSQPKFGRINTGKSRIFLADNRFFQVQVIVAGDAPSPDSDRFLDSFKVVAAKPDAASP